MTIFNKDRCITHGTSGIVKQNLLLLGAHNMEKLARLLEIIVVVFMKRPVLGFTRQTKWRFFVLRLAFPLVVAIGLVVQQAAVVTVDTPLPIAAVTKHWALRPNSRNMVTVGSATITLRIGIAKQTGLQHAIGAGTDTRY